MSFVNTIDLLGDNVVLKNLVEKTIAEFKDDTITTINNNAFYQCKNLTLVDLPAVTKIGEQAFYGCLSLSIIILRNEKASTLGSVALTGTQISNNGHIYVPRALVDAYKTAAYWKTYAERFRTLEDYTVDGTTTGELDTTKI